MSMKKIKRKLPKGRKLLRSLKDVKAAAQASVHVLNQVSKSHEKP